MEFSLTTVYDYPAIKALQYAVLYKNKNPTLRVTLRTLLCGFVALMFGVPVVYLLCTGASEEVRPIWVGLAMAFFVLLFVNLYCHIALPKIAYRANSRNGEAKVTFTFRDTDFTVDAAANGVSSSSIVAYSSLFGAYRTKGYYLLFLAKGNANLVSRAELSAEQDKWLEDTLRDILGKTYRVCKF